MGCFLPAHNIIWLGPLSGGFFELRLIESFRQAWAPVGWLPERDFRGVRGRTCTNSPSCKSVSAAIAVRALLHLLNWVK